MYDAIIAAVDHNTDIQKTIENAEAALQPVLDEAKKDKAAEDLRLVREAAKEWIAQDPTLRYYQPFPPPMNESNPDILMNDELSMILSGGTINVISNRMDELNINATQLDISKIIMEEISRLLNIQIHTFSATPEFINPVTAQADQTRGRATSAQNRVAKASYDAARAPMFAELASARARTGVQL